ncbi:MAG: hypothetical protein COX79_03740 [Candidatus Levybacteria bacterium CG_4_10_14_0_2_um_filter_36_16]|nr:MAG: hypothetical protein AUK12_01895 [Candidatus Levybacteria bacterium CG2_30_37_29]PIZ97037.1 MAG: hypothetical protein COX79_03740 [Candidatus Levybacteria bacterium CG_4_10_14_0_2_um_filter_36_16]PJA90150.1 MAG: hypothetical protein CO136_03025 [Candidatus Levybacteria bacterium CG_4_9_14_3_um_filter_36_7]
MEKLIKKYNKPDSILVISSYPEKGVLYSGKVCAVGGFAKNTIRSVKKYLARKGQKRKIIVLTVTTGQEEIYVEDGILVIRIFERNNVLSYLSIFKTVRKFNKVKDTLVEFEFASFGDTKTAGFFPLTLMFLRLLEKNITLVLHQVTPSLDELWGHVGFKKNSLKLYFFNLIIKFFYFALTLFPQKIVVLEEIFKQRLAGLTDINKVTVIPHGVDKKVRKISKNSARAKLGIKKDEFVLLYFGYLTWYKGADWIIKNASENIPKTRKKKVKLIIAGGESFTQKNKPHYRDLLVKIHNFTRNNKNISITGFVEEKNIPLYFSACDLVVFPYRTVISSSGPLSLAFSFGKPLLMSSAFKDYFLSSDFSLALNENGLCEDDILFTMGEKNLFNIVKNIDKRKLAKLASFSINVAKKRSFTVLGKGYYDLISSKIESPVTSPVKLFRWLKLASFSN